MESKRPKVGVGVLVIKDGQLLLGQRVHSHGSGTWCPPGGHLEFGETPTECTARELQEETGMIATDICPGPWSNDFFEAEEKHYITVYMFVRGFEGVPKVTEPDKCSSWRWFPFNALPQPLFLTLRQLLEATSLESLNSQYLK